MSLPAGSYVVWAATTLNNDDGEARRVTCVLNMVFSQSTGVTLLGSNNQGASTDTMTLTGSVTLPGTTVVRLSCSHNETGDDDTNTQALNVELRAIRVGSLTTPP